MIVALLFSAVWVALLVWLITTLSAISRNTSRTVELLEEQRRRTPS